MITRVSRLILLVSLVLASVGCDQWTKYQAVASLTHGLDHVEGVGPRIAHFLGGALGNLFDRVRLGYVVDFVQWHYHDRLSWPVFNVADAWIFVGAVMLFCSSGRDLVVRELRNDPR